MLCRDLRINLSSLGENVVGRPSLKSGVAVSKWDPKDTTNPEELGEYTEGDILFIAGADMLRNGLAASSTRWPGGVIPFRIDGDFGKAPWTASTSR